MFSRRSFYVIKKIILCYQEDYPMLSRRLSYIYHEDYPMLSRRSFYVIKRRALLKDIYIYIERLINLNSICWQNIARNIISYTIIDNQVSSDLYAEVTLWQTSTTLHALLNGMDLCFWKQRAAAVYIYVLLLKRQPGGEGEGPKGISSVIWEG